MTRLIPERIVKTWPKKDQDAYRAVMLRDAVRRVDEALRKARLAEGKEA